MKINIIILVTFLVNSLSAQSKIVGTWYNVDDTDGKPKSHIQIYENNGNLEGKVIKLLPAATLKNCTSCAGSNKGKPIEGMKILWDLEKENETSFEDGKILDPKSGKVYSCNISLDGPDKLLVRGYFGFSLLGRTQYWYRVK